MQIPAQAWWIFFGFASAWIVVVGMIVYCALKKFVHPAFESHWGGIGRGLGGWSISWTLVLSLIALVLTCTVAGIGFQIVSSLLQTPSKPDNIVAGSKTPPKSSTATTTAPPENGK